MDVEEGFTTSLLGKRILLVELQPHHGLMLDPLTEAMVTSGASVDLLTNHHHKKFASIPKTTNRVRKWKTLRSRIIWFASNRLPRMLAWFIQSKKYDAIVWSSLDRQSLRVAKYITIPQAGIVHEWREEFRTLPDLEPIKTRPDCSILTIGKHIKGTGIDSYFLPYHVTGFDPSTVSRSREMIVIGNYQQYRRDYDLLFSTVSKLNNMEEAPTISILTNSKSGDVQQGIEKRNSMGLEEQIHFIYSDNLRSELSYHEACSRATFCLPLLGAGMYESYRTTRVSGTLSKIFNCELIPIIDRKTAESWGIDESIAIIYEEADLEDGMNQSNNISMEQINEMQNKIRKLKNIEFQTSITNLVTCITDITSQK